MTVTASLDLWTILQGTKQLQRQNDLINLRIRQAGGVLKQDLEPFVFKILEDLETRIQEAVEGRQISAQELREIVHNIITDMMAEGVRTLIRRQACDKAGRPCIGCIHWSGDTCKYNGPPDSIPAKPSWRRR